MRIRKDLDVKAEQTLELSALADALSHPVRIALLKYVHTRTRSGDPLRNDVCNTDLVNYLDYAQATVSQHVKKLVSSGILIKEQVDKFNYYQINYSVLENYLMTMGELFEISR